MSEISPLQMVLGAAGVLSVMGTIAGSAFVFLSNQIDVLRLEERSIQLTNVEKTGLLEGELKIITQRLNDLEGDVDEFDDEFDRYKEQRAARIADIAGQVRNVSDRQSLYRDESRRMNQIFWDTINKGDPPFPAQFYVPPNVASTPVEAR